MTEKFLTSKKYLALGFLINPYGLAALGGFYLATARFSVERTLARSQESAATVSSPTALLGSNARASRSSIAPITVTGSLTPRRQIERTFDKWVAESIGRGLFSTRKALDRFAETLESLGVPEYGPDGNLRFRIQSEGKTRFVGVARTSIAAPDSDPQLAYKLMLSVVASELDAGGEHRPTNAELDEDWRIAQTLHDRPGVFDAPEPPLASRAKDHGCEPPHHPMFLLRSLKFIQH